MGNSDMAGLLVNVQAIDDLDLPLKLVYGYLDVGPSSFQFVGVCSARLRLLKFFLF